MAMAATRSSAWQWIGLMLVLLCAGTACLEPEIEALVSQVRADDLLIACRAYGLSVPPGASREEIAAVMMQHGPTAELLRREARARSGGEGGAGAEAETAPASTPAEDSTPDAAADLPEGGGSVDEQMSGGWGDDDDDDDELEIVDLDDETDEAQSAGAASVESPDEPARAAADASTPPAGTDADADAAAAADEMAAADAPSGASREAAEAAAAAAEPESADDAGVDELARDPGSMPPPAEPAPRMPAADSSRRADPADEGGQPGAARAARWGGGSGGAEDAERTAEGEHDLSGDVEDGATRRGRDADAAHPEEADTDSASSAARPLLLDGALNRLFVLADADDDLKLSQRDMLDGIVGAGQMLLSTYGCALPPGTSISVRQLMDGLSELFDACDADGDGLLSLTEAQAPRCRGYLLEQLEGLECDGDGEAERPGARSSGPWLLRLVRTPGEALLDAHRRAASDALRGWRNALHAGRSAFGQVAASVARAADAALLRSSPLGRSIGERLRDVDWEALVISLRTHAIWLSVGLAFGLCVTQSPSGDERYPLFTTGDGAGGTGAGDGADEWVDDD